MVSNKPFLKNLNGLRFLAASYTIFFHYFYFPESKFLTAFFSHGHISVPFFFLLSGFVLSYSYQDYDFFSGTNNKNYIISRFIRLAPIYYISMFLAIPLIYYGQRDLPLSIFENLFYGLTHLLMGQAIISSHKMSSFWNVHSWSLSVEMFLYVCSPYLIFKIKSFTEQKLYLLLLILFGLNSAIFFLSLEPTNLFNTLSSHFAPIYLATFLSGIALAKLYLLKSPFFDKYSSSLFILSATLLVTSFFLNFENQFYSSFNPLFQLGFAVLIISSCKQNIFNRFLGGKLFFFLGEASYAMYILQAPIKTFTQQFLSKIVGFGRHDGLLFCSIIYFSILGCAIILSTVIDPRARKYLRTKLLT